MSFRKPKVISLFAGGGGSSLGYKMAGYDELLAIDFDKNSCDTLKLNFDFPIWEKNIYEVKGKDILDFCKIKKGDLDILDGSPPCQGFSMSGKRIITDTRNNLFLEYIRILKELSPKVFVMENVKGMVTGRMGGIFNKIIEMLNNCDYQVKCKLMNAVFYNVPQSRERLIFIGVRKDLNLEPSFPSPNKNFINIKTALQGVNNKTFGKPLTPNFLKLWKQLSIGECGNKYRGKNSYFNWFKVNSILPSRTVTKKTTGCLLHWKEPRYFTIEECKRLCSFPDDYKLIGSYSSQWARLGNSVMPNFMKAIAENIKLNILDKIN